MNHVRCNMRILVCYKYVPDENEISVNPDRTMKLDAAPWVISPYDLNAIEAGMKLAEAAGESTVEVLTAAGEVLDNTKMRKAVLSRGPAKMYGVKSAACGDLFSTASLLAKAVRRIEGVDLVICGEGSGDMYSQELGNMLAAMLDVPAVNGVEELAYAGGAVLASRSNGSRRETLRLSGMAVVSVTSDICRAHIPSMKEILAAGKKPVEIWDAAELGECAAASETVSVLAPERAERKRVVFRESDEDGVDEFAKTIKKYL